MSDIIVKQQPESNLTIQSSEDQVVIRQAADNVVVVQTTGSSYTLPAATANSLGGIIVGSNLTIANGVLSATSSGGGVTAFNNRTGNVSLTANDVTAVANGIYQANGSYLDDRLTTIPMAYGNDALSGMRKSAGGSANFVAGPTSLGGFASVGIYVGNEASAVEFGTGDVFATLRLRHYRHILLIWEQGFEVETGTANWSWSANSILTQGRGDSRYYFANNPSGFITAACLTYSNITGTLPTATNTTLGAVKVGQTLEIANGVLNVTDLTLFGGTATASGPDVYFGGGA